MDDIDKPKLLSKINYITSYRRSDKDIENDPGVVRLKLDKLTYSWKVRNDTNKKIFHLIYDEILVTRKNNYIVSYNCITCNRENIICLNNFIKKIERCTEKCFTCLSSKGGDITIEDKILEDRKDFLVLDAKKKQSYEKKLMSVDHFQSIRKYLLSYNNDKFCNINDIVYIPYYRPTESNKYYEPCFYNKNLNIISRAINLVFECHHCKNRVTFNNLNPLRKKHVIYCKMCSCQFGCTKYKYEANIHGVNVGHKTKMQHKFLKYCNKKGILCENGPSDLSFKDIDGNVSIAFYLPRHRLFIDVLSNLDFDEYSKNNNNKNARTLLIEDYLSKNNLGDYTIIHPKNYVSVTRKLLYSTLNYS